MYDAEQINEAYADMPAAKHICGCIRMGYFCGLLSERRVMLIAAFLFNQSAQS
jgi:hypothetical protein